MPEAADFLAKHSPDTVLVAAGGVGDGRGLAAALMLGADGVLVETRFVASQESAAPVQIVKGMVAQACQLLGSHSRYLVGKQGAAATILPPSRAGASGGACDPSGNMAEG